MHLFFTPYTVYSQCLVPMGVIDQHYALIITPLFITQAPTCFGIHMPSSGSVLFAYELLKRQKCLL
jgi:hypothetical protein